MGLKGAGGYYANWAGMRSGAQDVRERAEYVAAVRDELQALFAAEGNPLGGDQYGAELAKTFPAQKEAIFDLFRSHIDYLDGVRDGLVNGAKAYETAEGPEG
ncbi:hypothetical protein [Streptosporangium minutum]|uniref:hypothetical protein n=1 Tax=Streptosporangium minutum TaxID=569862 RepID=UPI0013FD300E|nr:hypothetical protein [Streptosporangium minutum]